MQFLDSDFAGPLIYFVVGILIMAPLGLIRLMRYRPARRFSRFGSNLSFTNYFDTGCGSGSADSYHPGYQSHYGHHFGGHHGGGHHGSGHYGGFGGGHDGGGHGGGHH